MSETYCYVEFEAPESDALSRLHSLVQRLISDLAAGTRPEKEWLRLFTDAELQTFWWPNAQQLPAIRERWGDVPILVSSKSENAQRDWDVYSMFEIIAESEYTLEGVKPIGSRLYRLAFNPMAYPFGGTNSLQRLVRAFGFTVVAVDDGTGRVEGATPVTEVAEPKPLGPIPQKKAWWRFWT